MTTRTKKKSTNLNESDSKPVKKVENSWMLLGTDKLFKNSSFTIITLPHPAHGGPSKYCLDDDNSKMYEVVTFDEPYRSWFIGETVKSDGSVLILSPFNPVFLLLPRLKEQCASRAVPLEDLLSEKGFENLSDFVSDLSMVADPKGPPELKAYKYNEEKSLEWLEGRVRKVAKLLKQKKMHVRSGAVSATFVASTVDSDSVDEEFYLKYAHGLISEYLQDDFVDALEKRFDFKPELIETLGKKRKSEVESIGTSKKIKCEENEDLKENGFTSPNQSVEAKKPKVLTAKEKARQKAASGTKTISSFFTKK